MSDLRARLIASIAQVEEEQDMHRNEVEAVFGEPRVVTGPEGVFAHLIPPPEPTKLEASLANLIAAHGLRTASVSMSTAAPAFAFTIYLHWSVPDGQTCAQGTGPTIAAALSDAIARMAVKRPAKLDGALP